MLLHELFLDRAGRDPTLPAIDFDGRTITYGEAAERVERLAGGLGAELSPGERVALNLRKSPDAILLMLACLRAGLTYVPIDPSSPRPRREFILRDSGARMLVVDQHTARDWGGEDAPIQPRTVADLEAAASGHPSGGGPGGQGDGRSRDPDPDALAYVLYTSGSTGDPKGVQITHGNAAAFVAWAMEYADLGPGDRVAVHAPLHFDLPVLDVYASLGRGATVCPIDERTTLFPQALLRFLRDREITVLYAVPSALTALVNRSKLADGGLPRLRLLLYAGEEFHPGPLRRLVEALDGVAVHNLYGPIETNVVTALQIRPEHLELRRIPIGAPVPHARIFLLDDDERVVDEPGREGEILVAGPSVTPGYLNRPDLTADARFTVRTAEGDFDCHRTGDYATWGEDGVLNFLGRRDGLVKTRGFRVELGEIEAALLDHPRVLEAAVVAEPDPDYTNLLYGFAVVEPGAEVGTDELTEWCKRALPSHAVPQEIVIRPDFPRTSTGKISRRELAKAR